MQDLSEMYNIQVMQERFGALVSARVNEILAGKAKQLDFQKIASMVDNPDVQSLLMADVIARVVCANLHRTDFGPDAAEESSK